MNKNLYVVAYIVRLNTEGRVGTTFAKLNLGIYPVDVANAKAEELANMVFTKNGSSLIEKWLRLVGDLYPNDELHIRFKASKTI
jgi:hypothetical protein